MSSDRPGIPVVIRETHGLRRNLAHARIGVPLPRGMAADPSAFGAIDSQGRRLPFQGRVLARWPDKSVKWLLSDMLCAAEPGATIQCHILPCEADPEGTERGPRMQVRTVHDAFVVDSGAAQFVIGRRGTVLLRSVERN